jgi:septum formation inhibitor MinC
MIGSLTIAFREARDAAQKARRMSEEHERAYRAAGPEHGTLDMRGSELKRVASEASVKLDVAERAMRAAAAVERRKEQDAADAGLQSQLRDEAQARRDAAAAAERARPRRTRRDR